MSHAVQDKELALQEKQKGNHAFASKDWATAVGHYTAAQIADPTEPTIPLNRAMAYIKLSKFIDAERDCTTALRLTPGGPNVKAFFRRATARVGAEKLEDAQADFAQVLKLDPKNKEAAAELDKINRTLQQKQASKRTQPIDLTHLRSASATPGASSDESDQRPSTSSTVEAARKFLEQVNLEDTSSSQTKLNSQAAAKPVVRDLPAKYPGETGGLLRPVSTKRVSQSQPADVPKAIANQPPTSANATQPPFQVAPDAPAVSSAVKKTASALSFGGPAQAPVQVTSSAAPVSPSPSSRRINSVEFQRLWKASSRGPTPEATARQQLRFLGSIDSVSLPSTMGQLLEPDLLSSLLSALETNVRFACSTFDPAHRPLHFRDAGDQSSSELIRVSRDLLLSLPKCQRFAVTRSMLDGSEIGAAITLIHFLEDNGALQPLETANLHQTWQA